MGSVIKQWANKFSLWGEWIGAIGIIIMVVTTCVDILGAKLFGLPVAGSTEIVSLTQVAAIIFAVASTQRHRGHISAEMFVEKMPVRIRATAKTLVSLLGLILFLLLIYEGVRLGNIYYTSREATATIQIPLFPFAYAFTVALFPVAMMMLADLMEGIKEVLA
jgi:TRAP-type C4-dicarboxylate transport system permease small subunit